MRIPIDRIIPDPSQPRKTFDGEAIEELAGSFDSYGVISPLKVRPCGDNQYMIIVGEMRWRAASHREDKEIECVVQDATDQQAREMQFIENLQRNDIPPFELAKALKEYCQKYNVSQAALSRLIGFRDKHSVGDRIRMVDNLSGDLIPPLKNGRIIYTEAKEIAKIPDHERQKEVAEAFIKGEVHSGHAQKIAEIARKEPSRPVQDIIEEVTKGKVEEREAARLEAAKRALEMPLETPEELIRGAEALKKEAERKAKEAMTPGEKAEEERKKLVAEARKALDSTAKKIDRTSQVMDVSEFRERLGNIEQGLDKEPAEAKTQLVALGQDVTEAEKKARAEERKKREEEQKQRIEAEARKKVWQEALNEPEFLKQAVAKAEDLSVRQALEQPVTEIEGEAAVSEAEIAEAMAGAEEKGFVFKLESDLYNLAKLRQIPPKEIVATLPSNRLEGLERDLPGYIDFLQQILSLIREKLEIGRW